MPRIPAHPLAEHPLDNLSRYFKCSVPASHRAFLHTLGIGGVKARDKGAPDIRRLGFL
jgi:hypothetical protein